MEKDITKTYSNGEINIIWKPSLCIHSTICWKETSGLPKLFDPRVKPWIRPLEANTKQIITQVNKCPSGALSYRNNKDKEELVLSNETLVETVAGGSLLVHGNLLVKDHKGNEAKKNKLTAFCRCGNSANKPYCDGSHHKHHFKG